MNDCCGRAGKTPIAVAALGDRLEPSVVGVCICLSLASKAAILSFVLFGRPCVLIRESVVGRDVSVPFRPPGLEEPTSDPSWELEDCCCAKVTTNLRPRTTLSCRLIRAFEASFPRSNSQFEAMGKVPKVDAHEPLGQNIQQRRTRAVSLSEDQSCERGSRALISCRILRRFEAECIWMYQVKIITSNVMVNSLVDCRMKVTDIESVLANRNDSLCTCGS